MHPFAAIAAFLAVLVLVFATGVNVGTVRHARIIDPETQATSVIGADTAEQLEREAQAVEAYGFGTGQTDETGLTVAITRSVIGTGKDLEMPELTLPKISVGERLLGIEIHIVNGGAAPVRGFDCEWFMLLNTTHNVLDPLDEVPDCDDIDGGDDALPVGGSYTSIMVFRLERGEIPIALNFHNFAPGTGEDGVELKFTAEPLRSIESTA